MDLLDVINPNKEFKRVFLRPKRQYYTPSESSAASVSSYDVRQESISGTDYVKQYVDEEDKKALEAAKLSNYHNDGAKIDEMSVGTVPTIGAEIENEELTKVYTTFDFEHRPKDLPILNNKEEIVSMVQTHSITVIEGATGCGKSTQVPQFILDSYCSQRKYCNIIVTQPRRIAAMSVADRVSRERKWPLGTLVGVQVGMYRNISKDTRLTFCTTGVLLRKLITAKNMLEYTHVILDEVHERDQEMDFLLLVIRKFLRTNSRQVKIVLMSATFNVEKFSSYFSVPTESGFVPAPVVSIGKKNNYRNYNYYLNELNSLGAIPEISASEPKVTTKMIDFCIKLIKVLDGIDTGSEYDADDLVEFGGERPRHAVLVFLPGIWEIEEMHNLMIRTSESSKWDIVILHSSITHEEQSKIFTAPPKGYRRIILSTNIAESSITIDDVKYVIDFCLTKQLITDPSTNFQCLELAWASKANCEQRAGRAGRVMDGRIYRFIPKWFYEELQPESIPEIKRAPLENLVLQTKLLDMGEPKAVLALAIDPPDLSNLERTILLLKEVGGLLDKPYIINRFDGELTDLGRIMAALPIEIHLAKLIALGHVFNVLRDAIIMSASMAMKSMFNNPFLKRLEAYNAKVNWADGTTSDSIAFLNAYSVWHSEITSNRMKKKSANERSWASRNFIQVRVIHEVDYLVSELTNRLEKLGIKETMGPNKIVLDAVDRGFVLKVVIAGAFYPNYFVRTYAPSLEGDQTQGTRELGGLDPTRTVYLQGWKPDQPGRLYAKRIQELFENVVPMYDQALVEFDTSERVYIMFSDEKLYGNERKQAQIPGKVSPSVYKALKLRKIGTELNIAVLDLKSAKQIAEKLDVPMYSSSMFFNNENYQAMCKLLPKTVPLLPGLDITSVEIQVVHSTDPNKFWVRNNDRETLSNLIKIENFLNDPKNITLVPVETKPLPTIGSLVAAEYKNKMYRVTIESYYKLKNEDVANVFYIDYGFRNSVRLVNLKVIKSDHDIYQLPALAYQCTLSHIEPSRKRDAKGVWSKEACALFNKYVNAPYSVFGEVFSVVDSIVSLKLTCKNLNDTQDSVNLNNLFVEEGLADVAEESYLSKYNHKLRELQLTDCNLLQRQYLEYLQYSKNFMINAYPDPPPLEECHSEINLRGPFSPLEINLSTLAIHTTCKRVGIDSGSVNSILLDTDPDDPHERLFVSSIVSQNQSGTQLTLRNTTLLPNIPGLTALICLMFAPKIELRRSSSGSHYIGALCGLGYDPRTGHSLMQEHDMEIYFDTQVTIEDLQNINRLRHWMNMGICVKTDELDDLNEQALQCQYKVYELLRKLIDRPVKSQNPEKLVHFARWNLYDESLFLLPTKAAIKEDSIYPLHRALHLEVFEEETEEMTQHMYDLRELAVSDPRLKENIEIHCKLCDEEILGREGLRIHLFTKEHREKEKLLGIRIS